MLALEMRARLRSTLISIAVLHELMERGGKISILDDSVLELIRLCLNELREGGFVRRDGDYFVPTPSAAPVMKSIAALYARLAALNIFEHVAVNLAPESLPLDGTDANVIHPGCHDPRFPSTNEECDALRAAGIQVEDLRVWMCELVGLSPHIVFFLNILRDRTIPKDERFWLDLRLDHQLNELDRRIDNAYRWHEAWGPPEEGMRQARYWYEAGMRELTKRNGRHCGKCNVSLAMIELELSAQGETLEFCPNPDCRASFLEPPAPQFQCPRCQYVMHAQEPRCPNCNIDFDHRLAAGTIEERVTTVPAITAATGHKYDIVVEEKPIVYWSCDGCVDIKTIWTPVVLF